MLMNRIPLAQSFQSKVDRGEKRAAITIRCEVRQGTRPWQLVLLEDLSPSGFRISGLAYADLTKLLSIRMPGMQLQSARLCWHIGPLVGCEFTCPLHIAVFEHLVKQTRAF
jgi:hypothetical protein